MVERRLGADRLAQAALVDRQALDPGLARSPCQHRLCRSRRRSPRTRGRSWSTRNERLERLERRHALARDPDGRRDRGHRDRPVADVLQQLDLAAAGVGRDGGQRSRPGGGDLLDELVERDAVRDALGSSRTRRLSGDLRFPAGGVGRLAVVVVVTTGREPQRERQAGGDRRQAPDPRAFPHLIAPLSSRRMTAPARARPTTGREGGAAAPGSRRPYPSTAAGCQHRHEVRPGMRNPACHRGFQAPETRPEGAPSR